MVSLLQEVKTDPLRDTFNRHDKDGNGYLDITEIEQVPPQRTRTCSRAGSRIHLTHCCPHLFAQVLAKLHLFDGPVRSPICKQMSTVSFSKTRLTVGARLVQDKKWGVAAAKLVQDFDVDKDGLISLE